MFLRTSEGMHGTCRFSAAVSWMLLLIELGSIIFSRFDWKSPVWRRCDFTPTFAQRAWLFLHCGCIFAITDEKMFFGTVFYSNLELFLGMLLVLVPDWDSVLLLIPSLCHRSPGARLERCEELHHWQMVHMGQPVSDWREKETGGGRGGWKEEWSGQASSRLWFMKMLAVAIFRCWSSGLSLHSDSQLLAKAAAFAHIVRCCSVLIQVQG